MRHKHADLIKQWAENTTQVFEFKSKLDGVWRATGRPSWSDDYEYRIRHKHQDLIDQKEARPDLIVEMWLPVSETWLDVSKPLWKEEVEYRLVEPEPPKKKVEMWQWVVRDPEGITTTGNFYTDVFGVKDYWSEDQIIQRADWTRIEVEE